jgi:two-component system sensor histidine kinase BaeS
LFANLLENSVRYTRPGGKVALHAQVDGPWLDILIDDSAPGVPADALPHLAERFYRVEQSRNRDLGGAGLGLALCQRIADAHGATLEFSASPLGGLRVSVRLKLEHP